MKQHLPYYISQNEDLKRTLLSQEGGIMKYLAEHLDADGLDATYKGYRDLCTHDFREAHKWSMSEEKIKLDALNNQHIKDELNYKETLNSELNDVPAEVAKMINDFIEKYLEYAYDENRQRTHPNGITPKDFYQEVTNQYREPLGLANECMKLLLLEHRHEDREEKRWYPPSDIATTKFFIRQYVRLLNNNDTFYRLRQGVREILSGKSDDECRQLAIDMMQGVRFFSQSLYDSSNIYIDYLDGYGTFHPDGKWLRKIIENRPSCKRNSLHFCFSVFVWRLREIGRIWAAQLLVHGIDMHELEKGTNCILFPVEGDGTRSLFPYNVDKYYSNEPPGVYCVRDREHAKELLGMIKNKEDVSESLLEAISKSGITVNGDLVLSKHVEHEVANVEAGGIGIQNVYTSQKPKAVASKKKAADRKPASSKPKTLKYFVHGNKGIVRKQGERVRLVFTKWNHWGWIDGKTTTEDFDAFFEGEPRHCNITWKANTTILTILLQMLLKQPYIAKQTRQSASSMVEGQFGLTPNFDQSRLTGDDYFRMGVTTFLLDINNPLPLRDGGGDDDYELSDAALQAVLSGQLRTTKGI